MQPTQLLPHPHPHFPPHERVEPHAVLVRALTPPIGTMFWKRTSFRFDLDDINRPLFFVGTWEVEVYLYVSSATPDDPSFEANGGAVTIIMVHTGFLERRPWIPLEVDANAPEQDQEQAVPRMASHFEHTVTSTGNLITRTQLPSDNSGEIVGNPDDQRRRYRISFRDELPMFRSGGNDHFVFHASYEEEYVRRITTQGGRQIPNGVSFDINSATLQNPIHGFSVFRYDRISSFPVIFDFTLRAPGFPPLIAQTREINLRW
ncbi:hypothetical protein ONZ45_g3628 [Pleurotus djamor]|nr:hypothetical protein ONZ45_g3628 [Pleurotus djamor]